MQRIGERSARAVARPGIPLEKLLNQVSSRQFKGRRGLGCIPAVCCDEANANLFGEFGVAFSCLDSDGLMSGIDQPDLRCFTTLEKCIEMPAM